MTSRVGYVEFSREQMQHANIHKAKARHYYFEEFRSNCEANVMVYFQQEPVDYADYRIGMYYVSPFALRDGNGKSLGAPPEDRLGRKSLFDFLLD